MNEIISDFYNSLERSGIIWCHWKSNLHLMDGLTGKTDLDLLFYEKDKKPLEKIFREIGAVKFEAVKEKKYPKIDDYLVIDVVTCSLHHFHVHYQLDIGEKLIKSYRLPFVDYILGTRVKHPDLDFWIIKPELEIILLIIRQTLRIPPFTFFLKTLPSIGKNTLDEYLWLKKQINENDLKKISDSLFTKSITNLILNVIDKGITAECIMQIYKPFNIFFSKYRMKNSYSVFINLKYKKIILQVKDKLKSKGIHLPLKRVIAGKGIMIAFVGVDGSGKTTFVHEICNFFKPKIDVRFIYFGHGKSHESGLITFFKFLSKIMMKININYSKIILGIGIGIDKNVKISMVKNAKKSGMLIVCDRFPQTVIKGMCDGPRLDEYHNSTNMFLRFLSKWEIKIYNKCSSIAPDIIFKIVVKSQTAFKRRSENKDFTAIDKKNKAIMSVRWPESSLIVELNNDDSDIFLLKQKIITAIWRVIQER